LRRRDRIRRTLRTVCEEPGQQHRRRDERDRTVDIAGRDDEAGSAKERAAQDEKPEPPQAIVHQRERDRTDQTAEIDGRRNDDRAMPRHARTGENGRQPAVEDHHQHHVGEEHQPQQARREGTALAKEQPNGKSVLVLFRDDDVPAGQARIRRREQAHDPGHAVVRYPALDEDVQRFRQAPKQNRRDQTRQHPADHEKITPAVALCHACGSDAGDDRPESKADEDDQDDRDLARTRRVLTGQG